MHETVWSTWMLHLGISDDDTGMRRGGLSCLERVEPSQLFSKVCCMLPQPQELENDGP